MPWAVPVRSHDALRAATPTPAALSLASAESAHAPLAPLLTPLGRLGLTDADLRLWLGRLQPLPLALLEAAGLSSEERRRARRSQDPHWATSRALLRFLLAQALNIAPVEVRFRYSARGKPLVHTPGAESCSSLTFSLTHSADRGLYAISQTGRTLGVDIEHVVPFDEMDDVAAMMFTAGDQRRLKQVAPTLRVELFYRYWTRFEAVAKLRGVGLAEPNSGFEPDIELVHELTPENGLVAAVAVGVSREIAQDSVIPEGQP